MSSVVRQCSTKSRVLPSSARGQEASPAMPKAMVWGQG